MQEHDLAEEYQSAHRAFHSAETALLIAQNDVLHAMDQGKITLLVLLDLSASFDTVDYDVLFQRLKTGLVSMVLHWTGLDHICMEDRKLFALMMTSQKQRH